MAREARSALRLLPGLVTVLAWAASCSTAELTPIFGGPSTQDAAPDAPLEAAVADSAVDASEDVGDAGVDGDVSVDAVSDVMTDADAPEADAAEADAASPFTVAVDGFGAMWSIQLPAAQLVGSEIEEYTRKGQPLPECTATFKQQLVGFGAGCPSCSFGWTANLVDATLKGTCTEVGYVAGANSSRNPVEYGYGGVLTGTATTGDLWLKAGGSWQKIGSINFGDDPVAAADFTYTGVLP